MIDVKEKLAETIEAIEVLKQLGIPIPEEATEMKEIFERCVTAEELVRSACCIAERRGEVTHWGRFIDSVKAAGLNGVTARTYRVLPSDVQDAERLRDAISAAVRGIRAELADETQGAGETLGKIDIRVDELATVLSVSAG